MVGERPASDVGGVGATSGGGGGVDAAFSTAAAAVAAAAAAAPPAFRGRRGVRNAASTPTSTASASPASSPLFRVGVSCWPRGGCLG